MNAHIVGRYEIPSVHVRSALSVVHRTSLRKRNKRPSRTKITFDLFSVANVLNE